VDDGGALATHLGRLVGDLQMAHRMGAAGPERMAHNHAPDIQGRRFGEPLARVASTAGS